MNERAAPPSVETRPGLAWPVASAVAAGFALIGFVVAIVAGVVSGRAADSTLVHAIVALACCWPIGWVAGRVVGWQLGGAPRGDPESLRADNSTSIGSGAPTEAPGSDRTRGIVGTIGPEENPTMRQELRPRSRST